MIHYTVSLDAMGGDFGVTVVVEAAVAYLKDHPDTSLILVGDEQEIEGELSRINSGSSDRLRVHHASQRIEMDESPSRALRS